MFVCVYLYGRGWTSGDLTVLMYKSFTGKKKELQPKAQNVKSSQNKLYFKDAVGLI